jgi:hypothetical protein
MSTCPQAPGEGEKTPTAEDRELYFKLYRGDYVPAAMSQEEVKRDISLIAAHRLAACASLQVDLTLAHQIAMAEKDTLIYVPGSWECPKCNFQLTKSIMAVLSGSIVPDLAKAETCPNDGETMQRATWKKDAIRLSDRLCVEIPKLRDTEDRLAAAERELAELRKDKERLDWLETAPVVPFDATPLQGVEPEFQRMRVTRAAIDAAISAPDAPKP